MGIVKKTFGVADEIKGALRTFDNRIELGFIYGSIAKGTESKSSDIDLMLVGKELHYGELMEALVPLEDGLKRTINPTIYNPKDFKAKLEEGNSFVTRVMEQPKIMIQGKWDDTRESS